MHFGSEFQEMKLKMTEDFVEHEWTKHVSSSFIDTSIQALETSNLPLFVS